MFTITSISSEHKEQWLNLWKFYCGPNSVNDETTEYTWQRFFDDNSSIHCVVILRENMVVGFATYVLHESTWEIKPVCYVEDVYIDKKSRGNLLGTGTKLAQFFTHELSKGHFSRLEGMTRIENEVAQKLYGSFTQGEHYVRYVLKSK
jgi:hypothetical protein